MKKTVHEAKGIHLCANELLAMILFGKPPVQASGDDIGTWTGKVFNALQRSRVSGSRIRTLAVVTGQRSHVLGLPRHGGRPGGCGVQPRPHTSQTPAAIRGVQDQDV
jgi:hypothetical protein